MASSPSQRARRITSGLRASLVMLLLGLLACGRPCSIDAQSYNQFCNVDADCVAVHEGNLCKDSCWCANSVISIGDLAQYNLDQADRHAPHPGTCACNVEVTPSCIDQHCRTGALSSQ